MTLGEAVQILSTIREYFSISSVDKEEITLDGTFNLKELEAIITIFKNKDKIYLLEG